MDRTPLQDCVRFPLKESSETGQYLEALAKVSLVQESKLPSCMAASHVGLTGKPAVA